MCLGALRNLALDAARGELVCQWDDDDYSHPERLEMQASYLFRQDADACFLTEHLQYLDDQRAAFWVDWTNGGRQSGLPSWFPGTVMMRHSVRIRYPESGPYARTGEDTILMQELAANVPVVGLGGHAHLYLYQYHGRNAFSRDHHAQLRVWAADAGTVSRDERRIRETLVYATVPRPTVVAGRRRTCLRHRVIPPATHQTAASANLPEWVDACARKSSTCIPSGSIGSTTTRRVARWSPPSLHSAPHVRRVRHRGERADLFRVAAVYVSGGFYLDLDVDVHRPFDSLRDKHLVLAEETILTPGQAARLGNVHRQRIANYMFASEPRHPFWLELLEEMIHRAPRPIARDEDILESTGPGLFTDVYHGARERYPDLVLVGNDKLMCGRCGGIACQFGEFASHLHVGSWRGV